jgi:VanZ family protein
MRAVSRYAPPVLMMVVIFALSAQPDLNSGLGTWDTILRKIGHMAEFGLLWFLWWRALGYRNPAIPAMLAIGYAITDELHQAGVEGRHGSPLDVLIDATGVAIAMLLAARARARRRSDTVR